MDLGARLALQEGCLDELLEALGLEWADSADPRIAAFAERQPHFPQYHRIGHKRQLVVQHVTGNRPLVEQHYDQLVRALVHDEDPSSPRWLAAALVQAVGRRRVQESLVRVMEEGTPYQRACAAGAWNWVQAPLEYATEEDLHAGRPTRASLAERDALADLEARYRAALDTGSR
ncbi:hypothetical protein GCM10010193_02470 [Kitasatospora atroaurantiaca]|uniref:Uncharacterized protein n=1 Tax=Kitasatospora atroaurantiaca TaxID=285545 RepID=A0A561ELI3_9ACTN|nr:hypothetical protein [Kitasatospora atroaurantiaca]TWE16468.1 hypothetical protein FB465_1450 [Kitasatospora atroaurantiaca]